MPRGDRTGPTGLGPLTGRGAGFCAGFKVPGYANPIVGCGLGFGRGRMYKMPVWQELRILLISVQVGSLSKQ